MGLFRSRPSEDDHVPSGRDEQLASIGPGVPGRCPECGGLGYIDSIDIGHRFQIQHCKDCRHRWEYLFDAEGAVVGLTQLDDSGQPVARTRVRNRLESTVIDLRDPAPAAEAPAETDEPHARDHMSPAEWLRHSLRR